MNEIRLVKEDFKNKLVIKFLTYIMRKPYHSRMKDYKINKNLDFSKKNPFVNVKVFDHNNETGFTCLVPLKIWKILDKNTGLEYIKDYKHDLIDQQMLFGVGTGENVFWIVGDYIYSRNSSLYEEKLCKGSIKYNKEKNCAILLLNL